jgi:PleD family two-component response regulator
MQTRTAATRTSLQPTEARQVATERVVVVNGSQEMLELIETVLNPGRYNLVFIDSSAHAYSEIKRLRPNLVILCTRLENLDGFQVLSMLKLDKETRDIPVVTFTIEKETEIESEPELQDLRIAGLKN